MSNHFLEILKQNIANQAVESLGRQLVIENQNQMNNAGQSAINLLLNGLMKNISNNNGIGH